MDFHKELPTHFTSWVRFYLDVLPHLFPNQEILTMSIPNVFVEVSKRQKPTNDDIQTLHFEISYIKEKAFEEMIKLYFDFQKKDLSILLSIIDQNFEKLGMKGTKFHCMFSQLEKTIRK